MSGPEQRLEPTPALSNRRKLLGRLMWTCLGLAVPVGLIAAQHKLDEPWGTIEAFLLLVAFVCAMVRCFSSDKSSRRTDK